MWYYLANDWLLTYRVSQTKSRWVQMCQRCYWQRNTYQNSYMKRWKNGRSRWAWRGPAASRVRSVNSQHLPSIIVRPNLRFQTWLSRHYLVPVRTTIQVFQLLLLPTQSLIVSYTHEFSQRAKSLPVFNGSYSIHNCHANSIQVYEVFQTPRST